MENLDTGKSVEGTVLGCDFVGYVESIGSHVSKLQEGDLIAGLIAGGTNNSIHPFFALSAIYSIYTH